MYVYYPAYLIYIYIYIYIYISDKPDFRLLILTISTLHPAMTQRIRPLYICCYREGLNSSWRIPIFYIPFAISHPEAQGCRHYGRSGRKVF